MGGMRIEFLGIHHFYLSIVLIPEPKRNPRRRWLLCIMLLHDFISLRRRGGKMHVPFRILARVGVSSRSACPCGPAPWIVSRSVVKIRSLVESIQQVSSLGWSYPLSAVSTVVIGCAKSIRRRSCGHASHIPTANTPTSK